MDSTELDQEKLDQISEEFTASIRRGESPSVEDWVSRHDDSCGQLRELLSSVTIIEGLKSSALRNNQELSNSPALLAPTRLDDYRIVREIGRGGMGVVYEAVHESLARRVAVKVLTSRLTGNAAHLARFQREAKAAARLRHANIVPVFGVGQDEGTHYYVMEFISGKSVREFLRPALSENRSATTAVPSDPYHYCRWVAQLGAKLCDALQYAHNQDVLHRDVKPDNLLLDERGEIWITDFGLAKLTQPQSETQTGDLLGTPQYMAPESFEGRFDRRSEIYGIGLTLYEMLVKEPAIAGSNPADTLRKAMSGVTTLPRQSNPLIPRDLETVIVKSLAVDPAARYGSAGEMRDDLNRFLSDKPVLARRANVAEKTYRWARREPVLASLTIATIASLITALVIAGIGYYQTHKSLDAATTANAATEQSLKERSAALVLADQQRARAQNNLQVAISAFDEIMRNVTQRGESLDAEFLGELNETTSPEVSSADADLLQSLLGFFDELAENNSEDLRVQSADASRRVGDIYQRLGHLREADQAYQRSATLYESLCEQTPDKPSIAISLASVLNEQAVIAGLRGQSFHAGQLFERTILGLEQSDEVLQTPEGKYQKARAQMLMLSIRSRAGFDAKRIPPPIRGQGHTDATWDSEASDSSLGFASLRGPEAFSMANEAMDALQELTDAFPANIEYRMSLARAFRDGSKVARQNHFPGVAKSLMNQSLGLLEELLGESPQSDSIRYQLAKTLAVSEVGGVDQMLQLLRAIDICNSLLEKSPNVLRYQALKAHTLGSVAELQIDSGSDTDAIETLRAQVDIQRRLIKESPELLSYRTKLAQTLEHVSDLLQETGEPIQAARSLQHAIDALIPAVRRPEPSNVARTQLQRLRSKLIRIADQSL